MRMLHGVLCYALATSWKQGKSKIVFYAIEDFFTMGHAEVSA
jgi:hypothetical protein